MRNIVSGLIVALAAAGGTAHADEKALAEFYARNKLTIAVGFSPGGNYDLYARAVSRHIGRYIPGAPEVIVQNMPGAGSRVLANALYVRGPHDGTMIGVPNQGIPMDQALGLPGIQYDARRFHWIGSPNQEVNVAWTWHTSKVKTLDDARRIESVMGTTGPGSPTHYYPGVMNAMLGTKFKIVSGYPGSNELDGAIEKGEVDGRGAVSWAALKITSDWVKTGKVNILAQIGAAKAPDLPDTPLLHELAASPNDRAVLEFLSLAPALGRPFFMPPNTPAANVAAIRSAFMKTMTDKSFVEETTRSRLDLNPITGDELKRLTDKTLSASPAVIEAARKALQ
jgi:tripartite-type tricarboxylate transporter receptor subunit TctC